MKTIFRSAVMASLLIATSCGKDTAENVADELEKEAEQLEQTPLDANSVSDNVLIKGSTKVPGVPPTPNEGITLDVSDTSKTAFLGEGFDISLNSDTEIAGAYIQFKTADGTFADNYHNVNIDANTNTSNKLVRLKKKSLISVAAKPDSDATLDVDFNAEIEPGTFCYVICIYDAAGNISAPSEVCVTVESWGGSSAAIGRWVMVKEEKIEEDGSIRTFLSGVESCDEVDTLNCANTDTLETSRNCITINKENLTINTDGTYSYEYDENYKYLDSVTSEANCEAVFEDDSYIHISKGKWAFKSEDNTLVFLEFEYSDGIETEIYEEGNAELLFDGEVTLNGENLIGVMGEYKAFFEK